MLDLKVIQTRKEEIERSLKGMTFAPESVLERARLDLEICKGLLELRSSQ